MGTTPVPVLLMQQVERQAEGWLTATFSPLIQLRPLNPGLQLSRPDLQRLMRVVRLDEAAPVAVRLLASAERWLVAKGLRTGVTDVRRPVPPRVRPSQPRFDRFRAYHRANVFKHGLLA